MGSTLSLSFETFLPFILPVVFVGMFALAIRAAITQTRKTRENLNQLAATLGLDSRVPEPRSIFFFPQASIEGRFRGRSIRIYTYTTGSGKNRTTWCALSVQARVPVGFSLKISGENVFTKAGRVFGIDDIQTGDAAFDARFFVRSQHAGYVRAALIPEVRARLREAWERHGAHGSFTVESGEVKYAETGTFAKAAVCARFPHLLEIACDLAEIAEAAKA